MKYIKLYEEFIANKIECDNCGWTWKLEDGGNDLYICHKCGHDNIYGLRTSGPAQVG